MSEVIDMKKVKWELKKRELKEKATAKAVQVRDFVNRNREVLVAVVPAAAIGAKSIARCAGSFARGRAVKAETRDRQTRFYDHKLGQYWYTKRPLKQSEQLEVSRRKAAGESYGDIFRSMRLLK